MNREIVAGLVRHLVTVFGGVLVTHGYLTAGDFQQVAGAVAILAAMAWSAFVKHDRRR